MITKDYSQADITTAELEDLKIIAGVPISAIDLDDYPNLLVFPDSFESYDGDFGKKVICTISNDETTLFTNSIVGFIGRNNTRLSIHSRFAGEKEEDFFLHFMLQKVAKINLFRLQHTLDQDSVFDFLLYLFPLYLKKALNQGLYKQYVSHKYNDERIRGIINVDRHIRFNEPFNGKVAYTTREYSYDNNITQLIRHTLEYIAKQDCGKEILNSDRETKDAVAQIRSATPSYLSSNRQAVLHNNLRPIAHPFYNEYTPLQRLCVQILRHEEIKYGQEKDEVFGVLIDAAWLWEEYLAGVIDDKFQHLYKDQGKRFYLFQEIRQQIIPDYISLDRRIVADAKYIRLDEESLYGEEKATSIYYKTITYMHRFCSNEAFLLYPHPENKSTQSIVTYTILSETSSYGGTITKVGLRIPTGCKDFADFSKRMNDNKNVFRSILCK